MELMGVFDETLVEPLAQVMGKLGVNRGMVVYGQDGLDESLHLRAYFGVRDKERLGFSPMN